ncbi:serine hydrolase domain-containing protein [Ruminiclostridium josui]|uniref:serine hydrolase domain-containing protein n=1 Tax=Ruminiclostridium josui TaxID=1499 RepID=UPI0006CF8F2C|nr:serine hydrolase [Ruminiclostridium josui]
MKKKLIFMICFSIIASLGIILLLNQYYIRDKKPLEFNSVKQIGIEGLQEYYKIPGFTYCIIRDGKIIKMDALGYIFDGSKRKVSIEDKFQIGSCGKSYTALIASKLVEKGLISWDTKIFDLFPEWMNNSNQAYYSITLKDLLSHKTLLQPLNTFNGRKDFFRKKIIYTNIPISRVISKKEGFNFANMCLHFHQSKVLK